MKVRRSPCLPLEQLSYRISDIHGETVIHLLLVFRNSLCHFGHEVPLENISSREEPHPIHTESTQLSSHIECLGFYSPNCQISALRSAFVFCSQRLSLSA